jgi:hypothetical protein
VSAVLEGVGLVALVVALALAAGLALIGALVYAFYRYNRRRVHASAAAAASALGLAKRASADPRVDLYQGTLLDHHAYVATHAAWTEGEEGPSFEFQRNPVVVILVRFAAPLAPHFRATTAHMAPFTTKTGDLAFDQWFKIQAEDTGYAARLLSTQDVRDSLMRLYGPGMNPFGSGILIDIDARSLAVRCHEPRPQKAAEIARAAIAAATKLDQRAAFIAPESLHPGAPRPGTQLSPP